MLVDIDEYLKPLSQTRTILRTVLDGKPDLWLDSRHAEGVVTPRETVAHLLSCDAEESWLHRIKRMLNPEFVAPVGKYDGMSDEEITAAYPLDELLSEFERYRYANIRELYELKLTEEDLQRHVVREGFGTPTVANVLSAWVAHDLYHLGQIFKSYSALYIDRVGPYQQFLNLPHFN